MGNPVADNKFSLISRALAAIGANPISTFDGSTEATIAAQHYDNCYESLLTCYPWRFASNMVALVLETETPADVWPYSWALPSDLLIGQYVTVSGIDIEYDINGRHLFCNYNSGVVLAYTFRPDETQLPPFFKRALVHDLAAAFAGSLERAELQANQSREAQRWLTEARLKDSQSRTSRRMQNSRLVDVRRGFGTLRGQPNGQNV